MKKIILSTVVIAMLLSTNVIYAATGVVSASSLNVRRLASMSASKKTSLSRGTSVDILEEVQGDGSSWYKISAKNGTVTGYVSKAYITVNNTNQLTNVSSSDKNFEEHLAIQGFPESYKIHLRALHNKYPNWTFTAQKTGIDFDEVITNQSVIGRNFVHKDSISSWKSMEAGAYDYNNNSWVLFDGGKWVAASKDIIKYYIDPRNFLDEIYIFQFLDNAHKSKNYEVSALEAILSGTFLASKDIIDNVSNIINTSYGPGASLQAPSSQAQSSESLNYAQIIMKAGIESGVSPYVLAAMLIQEQGVNGSSGLISGKVASYEGYYNYFNVGAYQKGNQSPTISGLSFAKDVGAYDRPWNTRAKAIIGGAKYYGENYVNAGQNTLYLKKYNVLGANRYKHQYMTNVEGAAGEGAKLAKAYKDILKNEALEFCIPVYNNMPSEVSQKPTINSIQSSSKTKENVNTSFDNMYGPGVGLKKANTGTNENPSIGGFNDNTQKSGISTNINTNSNGPGVDSNKGGADVIKEKSGRVSLTPPG